MNSDLQKNRLKFILKEQLSDVSYDYIYMLSLLIRVGGGRSWTGCASEPWLISPLCVGALASIAYSRWGRTMVQYSGINAGSDNSKKGRRTVKRNRLTLFAVFLQCTDEVKVVWRGDACSLKFVFVFCPPTQNPEAKSLSSKNHAPICFFLQAKRDKWLFSSGD